MCRARAIDQHSYVKYHIDETAESPLCRLYVQKGESVQRIFSACGKLAHKDYNRRHNNVARKGLLGYMLERKIGMQ